MIDYSAIRHDYTNDELSESQVDTSPFNQFKVWFDEAIKSELFPDPNAMVLSTVNYEGFPSSRIVLLKDFSNESFTFFTNYNSRKSNNIAENPKASLLFFWDKMERQIRIEGSIIKTSKEQSENYFNSRPKESKLGAWASNQSHPTTKEELELNYNSLVNEFENKEVPYPDFWGGYSLIPNYFEFWQGRPSRMHDRITYTLTQNFWEIKRLAP